MNKEERENYKKSVQEQLREIEDDLATIADLIKTLSEFKSTRTPNEYEIDYVEQRTEELRRTQASKRFEHFQLNKFKDALDKPVK